MNWMGGIFVAALIAIEVFAFYAAVPMTRCVPVVPSIVKLCSITKLTACAQSLNNSALARAAAKRSDRANLAARLSRLGHTQLVHAMANGLLRAFQSNTGSGRVFTRDSASAHALLFFRCPEG